MLPIKKNLFQYYFDFIAFNLDPKFYELNPIKKVLIDLDLSVASNTICGKILWISFATSLLNILTVFLVTATTLYTFFPMTAPVEIRLDTGCFDLIGVI